MIYDSLTVKTIMYILILPNGDITAEIPSEAVSKNLLSEIEKWIKEGAKYEDIICRLRPKTVPPGYSYYAWISGMIG